VSLAARVTFQEELVAILKKRQIGCDQGYTWL
jgi:hypothetical protein